MFCGGIMAYDIRSATNRLDNIDGRRWDSLPLDGRAPVGFRVLA